MERRTTRPGSKLPLEKAAASGRTPYMVSFLELMLVWKTELIETLLLARLEAG